MRGRTHLSEAIQWSRATGTELLESLAAGFGMAGPVLLGASTGHLPAGLAASVGALTMGGTDIGSGIRAQIRGIADALVPTAIAALVAVVIAGHGWLTDLVLICLVGFAATIGGYSRPVAVATTRFILFLIMIVHVANEAKDHSGFLLLMATGAFWTIILNIAFGMLARSRRHADQTARALSLITPTSAQKMKRWKSNLTKLAGWQYTLRLILCLGVASGLRMLWPEHHFYWIALTVALLSQRQVEILPVKVTQRALGTALGVVAASLFVFHRPSDLGIFAGIALLASVRPFLKARNYLAYSAIMTPLIMLIMLIMDAGQPLGMNVLLDRLLATCIGAALVVVANILFRNAATSAA